MSAAMELHRNVQVRAKAAVDMRMISKPESILGKDRLVLYRTTDLAQVKDRNIYTAFTSLRTFPALYCHIREKLKRCLPIGHRQTARVHNYRQAN